MKFSSDDPRLSAYLLGELSASESVAVEHAVAADPSLRLSLDELKRVTSVLEDTLSETSRGLRPAQRDAVLRALRQADDRDRVIDFAPAVARRRNWLPVLGMAAAMVFAIFLASRFLLPQSDLSVERGEDVEEISLLPMPGEGRVKGGVAVAGGRGGASSAATGQMLTGGESVPLGPNIRAHDRLPDSARLPKLQPLPPLEFTGEISLPVLVGQASYGWIRGWVRGRSELPPKDAVRLEELVNAFPLALEEGEEFASAIEAAPCPWSADSDLIAVTLRAPDGPAVPIRWSFEPRAGARVRLLASPGSKQGRLPDLLPGGRTVTVLIEVAASDAPKRLGVVKLDVDGDFSGRIVERASVPASPAMRHLGLMAAFGLWLRGEGVDRETMRSMLADAGGDDDPGRADARRLVGETLALAEAGR